VAIYSLLAGCFAKKGRARARSSRRPIDPATLDVAMELRSNEAVRSVIEAGAGTTVISRLVVADKLSGGSLVGTSASLRESPLPRPVGRSGTARNHPKVEGENYGCVNTGCTTWAAVSNSRAQQASEDSPPRAVDDVSATPGVSFPAAASIAGIVSRRKIASTRKGSRSDPPSSHHVRIDINEPTMN
jgi:hypothetical protein